MKKATKRSSMPGPLSKEQACKIFRTAFNSGEVIWGVHSAQKIAKDGVEANDLIALARSGFIFNAPEPHIVTGAWTYRIEHPVEHLKVVFEVVDKRKSKIRLITIIGKK